MTSSHSTPGAAWFTLPQSAVARRTDFWAVVRSFVFILVGLAAFAASFVAGDAGSTLSMLLMTVGTLILLWGLFSLFWKSQHWVYIPTSSPLSHETLYLDVADWHDLLAQLQSPLSGNRITARVKPNGNVRLDYVFSRDHQYVVAQLYRFVPYTYEPASPAFYYTGAASEAFLRRLVSRDF